MPRHKFGAIAKSRLDIISKPSSIGRIYWHRATDPGPFFPPILQWASHLHIARERPDAAHKRCDMQEFRAAWRNDNDVLVRKLTGHFALHEIHDSLDLARDYGVCHVPVALTSHEASIDRLSEEEYQRDIKAARLQTELSQADIEAAGTASMQVVFRVTNWSAKQYTTKQHIVWALPTMTRESQPIVWPVWGILQDAALALEDLGHHLTLRRQLEPRFPEFLPRSVLEDPGALITERG